LEDAVAKDFEGFKARLRREVLGHRVIFANPYTDWFARGTLSREQARAFLVQFSVFSNEFLVAQLKKMLNAETIDEMRASKEILANEIGVGYTSGATDTELGGISGSIEGGTFHFRAAHFELLVRMARELGLGFGDLGKRRLAIPSTLFFCDELVRLYGHEDYSVAAAASWAVENWAAAGFWDELVRGWQGFRVRQSTPRLNLGFFTWHAKLEANHAHHTWEELAEFYAQHDIDEDVFVRHANEMLDGVHAFWQGLDEQRVGIDTSSHDAHLVAERTHAAG
jgi:hypothetical protein